VARYSRPFRHVLEVGAAFVRSASIDKEHSMKYQGSCHCGRVKFEVEGEINGAMACNCSMCQRKGSLLWFVPREKLHVLTPENDAATYMFNKHVIKHRFCPACGIHPYGEGTDPKGNSMAAINIRCLEGIDLAAIPVKNYDGRAL
jgi:hypothetical protein